MNKGYVYVHTPAHPNADRDGYVLEHRLVMESLVGRYLRRDELVHHLNHDKSDNNPENLVIVSHAEHMGKHRHRKYTDAALAAMRAGAAKGRASRWRHTSATE